MERTAEEAHLRDLDSMYARQRESGRQGCQASSCAGDDVEADSDDENRKRSARVLTLVLRCSTPSRFGVTVGP